ncbi:uncharacterized protein LOC135849029 [Planococcus citri]|uniref:uncharacterized protein LOC135849029 n=1 Tax=Planococcus citri TaxID=170843 RepID=UPI0031F97330
MNTGKKSEKFPTCVAACPASPHSEQENIINKYASITGNGIFLQDVYKNCQIEKMKIDICDKRPTPAIVWNKSMEGYEIGFELFYDEEKKINLPCWDYDKYIRIIDGKPDRNQKLPPNNKEIQSYNDNDSFSFQVKNKENDNPKFVFYFIEVLVITEFNLARNRMIAFTKDAINDNYFEETRKISRCRNYYFGGQKDETPIDENLEILGYEEYATKFNEKSDKTEKVKHHLEKTQIIPTHMFHTYWTRIATCTYLNTAFIWNTIANEQLKKVDLFLYAFYRIWPSEVNITFGVTGILKGIRDKVMKGFESEHHLFKQYPVPEIIFRRVEYRLKDEIYAAVIVIHNAVHYKLPPKRICIKNLHGWEDISNIGAEIPGKTYVCRLTKKIYEKLGINVATLPKIKDLRLDQLPHVKDKIGTVGYADVSLIVREEFKRIKDPDMSVESFNNEDVSEMIRRMKLEEANVKDPNVAA